MKKIILSFIVMFFLTGISLMAQDKPLSMKTDEELTKDEAVIRIAERQRIVADLDAKLKGLDADIERMKKELSETNQKLADCNQAYYSLLGVTKEDVEKFKQQLGLIEGRIRKMQRLSDDELADRQDEVKAIEADLNALRRNKISCIQEFYNKIIELARDVRGLYREKKISTYTVGTWAENRDCLWNIAGKMDIYGDPFQWPKIWQGNTNIIKNPDIIFPGQVLTIPPKGPLTPDEIKAERKYWRNKRAAMEQANQEQTGKKGE